MSADDFDPPLDPAIAHAVIALREAGIETFESCQAGTAMHTQNLLFAFTDNARKAGEH